MNAPVPPTTDRLVRTKRPPGRKPDTELGAETLADAHAVIDAVEAGRITKQHSTNVVAKRRRLTAKEERALAIAARTGDIDARNSLIMANIGLVYLVARPHRGLGEATYNDLVQAGIFGVMRAIETFEPERGLKFSTYAVHWIRTKMQRARDEMLRHDEPVVPVFTRGEDGDHYITRNDGRKVRRRHFAQSIDAPLVGQGNGEPFSGGETFKDSLMGDEPSPEVLAIRHEVEVAVREAVDAVIVEQYAERKGISSKHLIEIAGRVRRIVNERMLCEGESKTLQQLGDDLGLSRETIRLCENRVRAMLRRRLAQFAP